MEKVLCPQCGADSFLHYIDAYVVRRPLIDGEGKLEFSEEETRHYDDSFFDCDTCGYRYDGDELPTASAHEPARNRNKI